MPKNKIMTPNRNGKIAVVYARYSSHNQGEQSIEGQLEAAHAAALSRGYTIVHEYIDRAVSGRTDNREQFQQMLADTAKRQFDVILVWKVDRFGRNREEIAQNKYRCRKNGVRVEYVAETIPDSPEGVILESVLEGFAEYYSLQLSQNVLRGMRVSAEKCQAVGGGCPLGYKVGPDKKYIIDPDTAPTVKLIFKLYAEGQTAPEIVRVLNGKGLRTKRGTAFSKNSLFSVLRNEKYRGIYIFKDIRIEGGMPRMIDDVTFFKVQDLLKVNKRAPAHKWSKAEYLLTDKLFCGKCGSPMAGESGTGRSGRKYNYYLCSKKKQYKTCDKRAVRKDEIENIVINHALALLGDDELLNYIADAVYNYYLAKDESDADLKALESKLKRTETAIANLIRALEAGIFNADTKQRMDELQADKEQLTAAIAETKIMCDYKITREQILYFLRSLRDKDYTDRECQKRLIKTFINSVFVYDDKIVINFNYSGERSAVTVDDVDSVFASLAGTAEDSEQVFARCARWTTKTHTDFDTKCYQNGVQFFLCENP